MTSPITRKYDRPIPLLVEEMQAGSRGAATKGDVAKALAAERGVRWQIVSQRRER
jgi:hypothetical protein